MNIYEEEKLEKRLGEITDQFGYLLLDFLLISLKRLNSENQIFKPTFRTLRWIKL